VVEVEVVDTVTVVELTLGMRNLPLSSGTTPDNADMSEASMAIVAV